MILFGIYLCQAFLLAFAQRSGSGNDYLKKTEQGPWFTGQCNQLHINLACFIIFFLIWQKCQVNVKVFLLKLQT